MDTRLINTRWRLKLVVVVARLHLWLQRRVVFVLFGSGFVNKSGLDWRPLGWIFRWAAVQNRDVWYLRWRFFTQDKVLRLEIDEFELNLFSIIELNRIICSFIASFLPFADIREDNSSARCSGSSTRSREWDGGSDCRMTSSAPRRRSFCSFSAKSWFSASRLWSRYRLLSLWFHQLFDMLKKIKRIDKVGSNADISINHVAVERTMRFAI